MWMSMGVEAESPGTFSFSNYSLPHRGKYCAFEEIENRGIEVPCVRCRYTTASR